MRIGVQFCLSSPCGINEYLAIESDGKYKNYPVIEISELTAFVQQLQFGWMLPIEVEMVFS